MTKQPSTALLLTKFFDSCGEERRGLKEITEWNSLCLTDPFHCAGRPKLKLVQSHRYLVLRGKVGREKNSMLVPVL